MIADKAKQLQAILSDETFFRALIEAENAEAVQKLLAGKGVEMSLGEIEIMDELLTELQEGRITVEELEKLTACGELSEDELSTVAGGSPAARPSIAAHNNTNR